MRVARLLITTNILLMLILLMVLISGTETQVAQATGSNQIIACQAKSGGALRVASTCKSSETRLTWNIQGERGPQGLQGLQGLPGSSAAVGTQTVTFKYLSLKGGSIGCAPGTSLNAMTVGYVFPWWTSVTQDTSNQLSYARNWKAIYECQITLKVVQ